MGGVRHYPPTVCSETRHAPVQHPVGRQRGRFDASQLEFKAKSPKEVRTVWHFERLESVHLSYACGDAVPLRSRDTGGQSHKSSRRGTTFGLSGLFGVPELAGKVLWGEVVNLFSVCSLDCEAFFSRTLAMSCGAKWI